MAALTASESDLECVIPIMIDADVVVTASSFVVVIVVLDVADGPIVVVGRGGGGGEEAWNRPSITEAEVIM